MDKKQILKYKKRFSLHIASQAFILSKGLDDVKIDFQGLCRTLGYNRPAINEFLTTLIADLDRQTSDEDRMSYDK